jgi:hypothetical protein
MANTSRPQLPRRLRVAVVAPRADIAREHNLANLLAIFGRVHNLAFWKPLLDHSRRLGCDEAVALSRHVSVALLVRHMVPCWLVVAFCNGAIRFRQTVNMDRVEVQSAHQLE